MTDTKSKIAAGLERAFAMHGFAEPNIETLREAAGVSLRTLYKYVPSRQEMVLAALEHRHNRYMHHVFADVGGQRTLTFPMVLERIASWMENEASHGCLFHAAVAAAPDDAKLSDMLKRHKKEVIAQIAECCALQGREGEVAILTDGLMQSWPLHREAAMQSALYLADLLVGETNVVYGI